jgi:hypothetical protein
VSLPGYRETWAKRSVDCDFIHFLNRLSKVDLASSAAAFLGGPFEVRLDGMKKSQKFAFSLFDTHSA